MSAALFIVPERASVGIDVSINGKALGRSKGIDRLARQAGVRPLMEFFSQNPAEAADFIESEGLAAPAAAFRQNNGAPPKKGS